MNDNTYILTLMGDDAWKFNYQVDLNCVICGKQMTDIRDCNNPDPYPKELYVKTKNNHSYHCCRSCNLSTVIPARMEPHFLDRLKHKALLKSRKDKLLKINENRGSN